MKYVKNYQSKEDNTRIDARVARQEARRSEGDKELGLYIRISESSIYEWKPTLKSLLLQICYLRVKGETLLFRPKERRDPKIAYSGWCYAGEEYLAERVGCSGRQIRRMVKTLKQDGVVLVRTWRDSWGRPHNEYFIVEEVIDKYKRDAETTRAKCEWKVRKANAGTFSKDNQPRKKIATTSRGTRDTDKATGQLGREPRDISSVSHRSGSPSPTGQLVREPADKVSVEVGLGVGVGSEGLSSSYYENAPPAASPLTGGATAPRFAPFPASQEDQPQKQQQEQPQHHGGFAPKPPTDAPRPVSPPAAAQPPSPKRESFKSRYDYNLACYQADVIPEPEPGVPVPFRPDYETQYEYHVACWEAGVPPDTEDGKPTDYHRVSKPDPDWYCSVCGFELEECACRKKAAVAAGSGFEEDDLD